MMRTAILMGFILLGDAVNSAYVMTPSVTKFIGVTLLVMMIMDITDFFKKK